jgi:hypothetical protein
MEVPMRDLAKTKTGHRVVLLMLALATVLALTPTAGAMAGFAATIDSERIQPADLGSIQAALEIKKVSETLAAMGYDRQEIDARLGQLDQAELHALAGQLDQAMIPAGDGTAGVIIAVVVVFLVVLGVLSLMGKSVVVS